MQRTPPQGPATRRHQAHPSNANLQGQGTGPLYPPMDEGEPDSPSRHENVTPLGTTTDSEILQQILASVRAINTRLDDHQMQIQGFNGQIQGINGQIQDLNALFVRSSSSIGRDNRGDCSQSPAMTRRPSPMREARFGTAPPDLYGPPRRSREPEYTYAQPNLVRAGTIPPERPRYEREVSLQPREIPPYRQPGDARAPTSSAKASIKAPKFAGTDLENITIWIWKMENYLRGTRTPLEEYFTTALSYLEGDADAFVYDLVLKNDGENPSWDAFKVSMRQRYDKPSIRSDLLRLPLEQTRFEGPSQMIEYCTAFRAIKQQLYTMDFDDKLRHFLRPLPLNGQLHVKLMDLSARDMDVAYQAARQWAHTFEGLRASRPLHLRHPKKSTSHVRRPSGILATPAPKKEAPGEDLDVLNRMATDKDQCFKCGKNGHFQSNCPQGKSSSASSGGRRSQYTSKRGFGRPHRPSFKGMEEESDDLENENGRKRVHYYDESPDGYAEDLYSDENDDYEYQERSQSLRAMELCGSDSDMATSSDSDVNLTPGNLYELFSDGLEARTPKSTVLPIYDAEIADTMRKAIIDSGASTLYISQKITKELGLQTTKVKARRVKVADNDSCVVNTITTVDVKVGNLPAEMLTAYVFPLKDIDLVLGLSWLEKHNPHVDFRSKSYEFARNGRKYILHPARKPAKIRVVPPNEFRAFIQEDPERTYLSYLLPMVDLDTNDDANAASDPMERQISQISRQERRRLEREKAKMLDWIRKRHGNLLRTIGKPAKLEPFVIDTGDAEPIKISPRPYSPVDLEKIKEFIDNGVKNGIIRESESS